MPVSGVRAVTISRSEQLKLTELEQDKYEDPVYRFVYLFTHGGIMHGGLHDGLPNGSVLEEETQRVDNYEWLDIHTANDGSYTGASVRTEHIMCVMLQTAERKNVDGTVIPSDPDHTGAYA